MKKNIALLSGFMLAGFCSFGQINQHQGHHEEAPHKHWRLALVIGHTAVPSGEEPTHLFVPSWGLDAEYWVNPTWGLGLHTDMELQTFVVVLAEGERLEREYPFIATLELLVKPVKGLVLQVGPGYEFEKNEDLKLFRFGLEYEIEIHGGWDIAPTAFYDTRLNAFDTWTIGVGVGKRF